MEYDDAETMTLSKIITVSRTTIPKALVYLTKRSSIVIGTFLVCLEPLSFPYPCKQIVKNAFPNDQVPSKYLCHFLVCKLLGSNSKGRCQCERTVVLIDQSI